MLPASSLARRPEPLAAQHTAGARRGRAGQPGVAPASRLPPPPSSSLAIHLLPWVVGSPVGRCAGGDSVLREGPAGLARWPSTITHQPGGPETQPSGVDAARGALEPSACHPNPVRSCHASTALATLWSCHSHSTGDTRTARPLPVEQGHQGEGRLGRAQHLQVPCRAALPLHQGGPWRADSPPCPGHQAGARVRAGGRRGRRPGTRGSDGLVALLALCPGGSRPRGAPRPTRVLCGVAFHTLPCLPSLASLPNSECPAAPRGPPPPAPDRGAGPPAAATQAAPARPILRACLPSGDHEVPAWVKFRNARFRGKSLRTVINSAFPQAPLRTQCRLRKCREG